MSESAPDSTPERSPLGDPSDLRDVLLQHWPLVLGIVGGALLLLGIIILIVLLGLKQVSSRKPTPTITPALDDTPTPTTVSTSPLPTPSCETIISSGDVEVAASFPVSLTVGDEAFPVTPVVRGTGDPLYPSEQSGVATWLCGTVVNYVIGLEPTPENEAMLTSLRLGDNIKLQLASGAALSFRFVERKEATDERDVLRQQQPRLSLILEKEDIWQVAIADYIAEEEPIEAPASGTLAQPGRPTQVGDARVTVEEGYAERSDELAAGSMYYLVEFSVENVGTESLESSNFSMKLQDGNGNVYLLSPRASAAGEYGPLSKKIAPGAVVTGTAGYVVPDPLAGPTLTWLFKPRPGSDSQASVGIPYEGEEGGEEQEPTSEQVEVSLVDAFLNADGDTLIIEGEVRNTGDTPATIEAGDISLSSSAGIGNLQMAAPPLPWKIQPGQLQVIELQYERPEASAVLLELMGYSFEIEGL